ncbi:MAG: DNA replication and repair protein RecF [Saprospiraceae bacterium]
MILQKIILTRFKNYTNGSFTFDPKFNCIVGLNGSGKTNLLDAIYYLCMCKSNFGLNDALLVQHEQSFFRLEGYFNEGESVQKIVAKYTNKKKEFEKNDVTYNLLLEHIGKFPVVMITPDDNYILMENSEERRRFLDNLICQIDEQYLHDLMQYNKILKNRNAALKQMHSSNLEEILCVYDEQMLPLASYVYEKRKYWHTIIIDSLSNFYNDISDYKEVISLTYESMLHENDFIIGMLKNRQKDIALQRTNFGIHRDDLSLKIDNQPLKKFGSQGQIKSFIIALKLVQFHILKQETEIMPLLILDDLFDKLDNNRVTKLLKILSTTEYGQIFISNTNKGVLEQILQSNEQSYKFIEME